MDFWSRIFDFSECSGEGFFCYYQLAFVKIFDILKQIFAELLDLASEGLGAIGLPDWFTAPSTTVFSPEISWFLEPMELEYGLGLVTSAYLLRFTIRRLPVVG